MNNSMYSSTIMNSSMMSENYSVQSYVSSGGGGSGQQEAPPPVGGIMVEEIGNLIFGDIVPKKMVMLNYTLAILSDDGRLLLGEIRSRGGDDWALAGRSLVTLNDNDKRYLDVTLVSNIQQEKGSISILFLTEKIKNKERCLTAHNIKHGKILELKEEFSSYDKVNVLGKAVSHISSYDDPNEPPTVYAVSSNLVRKLRLEDGGTNLKPTTARAQVPGDCQDGTLAICIQPTSPRRASTAASAQNSNGYGTPGSWSSNQVNVIVAFRTKSAGKNKYTVEYYNSKSKGDEIFNSKCSIKLNEENEPTVLLTDPKDTRNVYALCVNKTNGTTLLYKISKGKRNDEPIRIFNYEIRSAAMSFSADKNILLVTYDGIGDIGRIYIIQKTEGFRGRHPVCSHCPSLETMSSPAHIVSCASTKWQLNNSQIEHIVGLNRPMIQLALASLVENGSGGKFTLEPDQETPYRIRILGCETQGVSPELILIEDLERTFDGGDEARLSSSVLKLCLGHSPSKDSYSRLSGLLMTGRISAIELHYVSPPAHDNHLFDGGSDRFILKPMNVEKFRSIVSDVDWSQTIMLNSSMTSSMSNGSGRQGTFTLEDQEKEMKQRPQSALTRGTSPRSSGGASGSHGAAAGSSRIPTPRTSVERSLSGRLSSASSSSSFQPPTLSNSHTPGVTNQHTATVVDSGPGSNGHSSLNNTDHHDGEKIQKLRSIVRRLSTTLNSILDADATMRSNLHSLREDVEEIMTQTEETQGVE